MFCFIIKIFKDTNRNSFTGFVLHENGLISAIILSDKLLVGAQVYSGLYRLLPTGTSNFYTNGSASPLSNIKIFSIINNIELKPYFGSKIIRSAGMRCTLISKTSNKAILKLTSG